MKIVSHDAWLSHARPRPHALVRLFCFPYAGAGASIFTPWSNELPSTIEVYPVQLPGREDQFMTPAFTSLSPLIQLLAEVLTAYIDVPYALFGHSMGALIAFELARYFRQLHFPKPVRLFVSGAYAPQVPGRFEDTPLHQLSESKLIAKLRALNGTPEAVLNSTEILHLLLPSLRADFEVCETYRYSAQEPLDCPISAFGGLQDSQISYSDLAAWAEQTTNDFNLRILPGDHFFIQSAQAMLLQALYYDLALSK